jgi:ribosomal protein S18 acetylase RimI-like enzyme
MEVVVKADLYNVHSAAAIANLLQMFAQDPMGSQFSLEPYLEDHLIDAFKINAGVHIVLAFIDDMPAGMALCFDNRSGFFYESVLRIQGLIIAPAYRGRYLSQRILAKAEEIARDLGLSAMTLEVAQDNRIARCAYATFGFFTVGYIGVDQPLQLQKNIGFISY